MMRRRTGTEHKKHKREQHKKHKEVLCFLCCSFLCFLCSVPVRLLAQEPTVRRASDGVFSSTQALRGKAAFDLSCSRCHNPALTGSERGPAIKGPAFVSRWEKDSLAGLFT